MELLKDFVEERGFIWSSWRRYFHHHPEKAGKETETLYFIKGLLEDMNLDFEEYDDTCIVNISGSEPGFTYLFETNLEAQEQVEKAKVPYRSKEYGLMHALGNDVKTTILLGICDYFSDHNLPKGKVKCVFRNNYNRKEKNSPNKNIPSDFIFQVSVNPKMLPEEILIYYENLKKSEFEKSVEDLNKIWPYLTIRFKNSKTTDELSTLSSKITLDLGCGFPDKENPPLGDSKFEVNEDCIPIGVFLGLGMIIEG
ncbi:MAG: hypothetical protein Q4Q07_05585 [Tissierellia bacterium]|nr:hypothetical protein [Tissierellia bacterium]